MKPDDLMMIPGPTPLPVAVREAMGRPAIGHRGEVFKGVLKRVFPALKKVFKTESDVLLYTASGTGGMEGALVNTLNPGDKVLALTCGVFSERWAQIGDKLGLDMERLSVPHGEPNTVDTLKKRLAADTAKEIKAVTLIHSETSTGVMNPVRELVSVIRDHGALSIVDTVTGLTAAAFKMDEWGVDIAVSGSQKGFMIPPGLAFVAVGPRAWEAHKQCKNPGFYFNFSKYKKAQDDWTTPYTPATHLILALDVALEMMLDEGIEAMNARHKKLQTMTRAGAKALGLQLFVPQEQLASHAVTAIVPPEHLSVGDIRRVLREKFGITIADGQLDLKGKIFRIGHLGYVTEREVYTVLSALEATLADLGHSISSGAAIAAAQKVDLELGVRCG